MSRTHRLPLVGMLLLIALAVLVLNGRAAAHDKTAAARGLKEDALSGVIELARAGLDARETLAPEALTAAAAARGAALTHKDDKGNTALELNSVAPVSGPLRDVMTTAPDWSLNPHNETSIAVNPTNPLNVIVGMNDYHLGFGMTGYAVTQDGGRTWVKGLVPMATLPISRTGRLANNGRVPDGGGDPVVVFGRDGTAYFAQLHFVREDVTPSGSIRTTGRNGIVVSASTNGGRTWTRPTLGAVPGANRYVVAYESDPATSITHDKEWLTIDTTTGRYSGRLYVTWTRFAPGENPIYEAHSSDGGVSWSTPKKISGASAWCDGDGTGVVSPCDHDQGSTSVVGPDGTVYVAFRNSDTPDENQVLLVRSRDGGETWEGPWKAADVYDSPGYYLYVDGPSCPDGPSTRARLPNSCFRVNAYGALAIDPVTGDLYYVLSDNRNGVRGVLKDRFNIATESPYVTDPVMDVDVFIVKSSDGGQTWTPAARVNQDPQGNRKQQWFPWVAVSDNGLIAVAYYDRRDDAADRLTNRYLSVAQRGTLTFTDTKLSSQAFDLNLAFRGGLFMGDYDQIAVNGGYIYGSWVDTRFATPAARFSDIFMSTRAVSAGVPVGR